MTFGFANDSKYKQKMDNGAPLTFNAPSFSIIRRCGATLAEGSGVVRDGMGVVRDGWDPCSAPLSGKKSFMRWSLHLGR